MSKHEKILFAWLSLLTIMIVWTFVNSFRVNKIWDQVAPTISQEEYENNVNECKNTPTICGDIYDGGYTTLRSLIWDIEDSLEQ